MIPFSLSVSAGDAPIACTIGLLEFLAFIRSKDEDLLFALADVDWRMPVHPFRELSS